MITVTDLTKRYARHTAVDHISFQVEKGQIVGFLGPNGAGKTTTMRMLTCFLPPTSGAATVAGFDVLEQAMEVKKSIGYLPETPPLYPEMRTEEYLSFVGSLKGLRGLELGKRVDYVCERCAIADMRLSVSRRWERRFKRWWAEARENSSGQSRMVWQKSGRRCFPFRRSSRADPSRACGKF